MMIFRGLMLWDGVATPLIAFRLVNKAQAGARALHWRNSPERRLAKGVEIAQEMDQLYFPTLGSFLA